jgi:F-type H+-transporting ATPase subunit alpha
MSEEEIQPDVSSLLKVLREQAREIEEGPRLRDAKDIRRISDKAAARVKQTRARPDVGSMLGSLKSRSQKMESRVRFYDVGTVQNIGDSVATLSGLPSARTDELVTFPTGVQGLILNLDHARIDVILLGSDEGIQGGDLVTATGRRVRVPVGPQMLGRVVDPLGQPLDDRGPIETATTRYLEQDAPDIVDRAPVQEPLHTGLKVVDALVPVGRGQRELVLGDRQTGKTALAVDAIINQRDTGVISVYVSTGQKKSSTLAVVETLRRYGAMQNTIVVIASPDDPPALRYLAPYAGCAMAEFFMHEGRDALIVYDDLSKHADAYRELSLLLRRPPGREAYPGDIFYIHARLLERACKLNEENGGGSLTALPIAETQRGDVSAYIPTNLISINDGQIFLDSDLFNRGIKPAVNVGQSVSRVGGEAQTRAMRAVASELKLELSQYEEVRRFSRFGTQVEEATRRQIRHGERLRAALKQPVHRPLSLAAQVVILLAATEGFLDEVDTGVIVEFERGLLEHVRKESPELLEQIDRTEDLGAEIRESLMEVMEAYRTQWMERGSA